MTMDRLQAIRRKNEAYAALVDALRHCDRRRHTFGAVPPAWLVRLGGLRGEWERAVLAWLAARARWGE